MSDAPPSAARGPSGPARRVLIVAPAFPPHPSPATHRARFLALHAPHLGWEVEVISVRPEFYEEPPDDELMRLVPPGLPITRTPAFRTRWTRRFGVGDIGMRAYFPMRRELRRVCRARRPDVLFIPGGPFHTFLLGADMREELGIPYVLDYTDPWVHPPAPDQASPRHKAYWHWRLARALEPRAVRGAAHILAVSDGTNDAIRERYPDVPPERFSAAPFGFEPTDFETLRRSGRANPYWDRGDGMRHLAYVGAMLPDGFETLRALFAAVNVLRTREPETFSRLRLHFFGTSYDVKASRGRVAPVAAEMGLGDVVTEHPRRIPYLDALNVLVSADAVLALGSTQHHYTASKIFPCLLAGRPLLAIYHEVSSVCDIVRASGVGELVTYGDRVRAEQRVDEVAEALARTVRSELSPPPSAAVLGRYSAESMTRQIVRTFERVVAQGGPATGRATAPGMRSSWAER